MREPLLTDRLTLRDITEADAHPQSHRPSFVVILSLIGISLLLGSGIYVLVFYLR